MPAIDYLLDDLFNPRMYFYRIKYLYAGKTEESTLPIFTDKKQAKEHLNKVLDTLQQIGLVMPPQEVKLYSFMVREEDDKELEK